MFKWAFYHCLELRKLSEDTVTAMLLLEDQVFLSELSRHIESSADSKHLIRFIKPFFRGNRSLLKEVLNTTPKMVDGNYPHLQRFIGSLAQSRGFDYAHLVRTSNELVRVLNQVLALAPPILSGELIVEVTPIKAKHEVYGPQNFQIWSERLGAFYPCSSVVGPLDAFLMNDQKVFIFAEAYVRDQIYKAMELYSPKRDWREFWDGILGEL